MADIFLSYASEDRATAGQVACQLEAVGFSVWWDRQIPAGMTWRQVIESALNDMGCMVVLWSTDSLASTWVSEEAEEGRMRGKLVPALLEPVLPPLGFRGIQAADLVDWDGSAEAAGFRHLVAGIEALLAPRRGVRPVAATASARAPGGGGRARLLAVAAACLLLLLLTAGTWYWLGQSEPDAASPARSGDATVSGKDASPWPGTAAPATTAAGGLRSRAGGSGADSAPTPKQDQTIAAAETARAPGAGDSPPPANSGGRASMPGPASTGGFESGRDSQAAGKVATSSGAAPVAGSQAKPASDPTPTPPTAAVADAGGASSISRPARRAAEPAARPARCRDLLERQSLGDPLGADERAYFQKECRT
ncbi:MAG: hypothetical protein FAZ92_00651 [Accumulibacter sp.]|mgnify:CR=1 FL=1|uniref:toll/interleukin-1 receptor domain-containing protein n=1 Tax=Accumulibacter sp. TaxID=2053492 RepID=UPI00122AD07B|nr:TIR domain-containing protein [Accumulibacter sp.]TLD47076.1 MAG: hypothetical protein FAZ92_00651 [Accumulibacter sp.]